jgi:plasmid stabilization system protein ParE
VAHVQLSESALEDLERLILTHSLPPDTKERLGRSLGHLERFPLLGPELEERWSGLRFLLGPWRWMLVVYAYLEPDDRVVVVSVEDGRSSSAPRSAVR